MKRSFTLFFIVILFLSVHPPARVLDGSKSAGFSLKDISRHVTGLMAEKNTLAITPGKLPPGFNFISVEQAGQTAVRKLVMTI